MSEPQPFRDHETCVPHEHVEPDAEKWERDQAATLAVSPRDTLDAAWAEAAHEEPETGVTYLDPCPVCGRRPNGRMRKWLAALAAEPIAASSRLDEIATIAAALNEADNRITETAFALPSLRQKRLAAALYDHGLRAERLRATPEPEG